MPGVQFAPNGGSEAAARHAEVTQQRDKELRARPPPAKAFQSAGSTFADIASLLHVESSTEDSQYDLFIAAHSKSLRVFASLRDEQRAMRHLAKHPLLLEGIAHVRKWFFLRHLAMCAKKGTKSAGDVQDEAAGFFLLDAAADAARTLLQASDNGGMSALSASTEGVGMLAMALSAPGDPVGLRPRVTERVLAWTELVGQRARAPAAAGNRKAAAKKPAQDPARLLPGLGYEVLGPIAAGAFSTILRCRGIESGLEVAVKSFDATKCAKDPAVAEARDRELMLEYCEGGSLKRYLQSLQKATPIGKGMAAKAGKGGLGMAAPLAARATGQLVSALAHMHGLGICHGDVKPANVLLLRPLENSRALAEGGLASLHVKLCDFGFACICENRKLKTFCGTPSYLPPEAVNATEAHKGYYGKPVDMWALGCVLYEMLHGRPAFSAQESFALEARVRNANHHPISAETPGFAKSLIAGLLTVSVPKRLTAEAVLERAWVKEVLMTSSEVERREGGGGGGVAPTGAEPEASKAEEKEEEGGGGLLSGMMRLLSA